MFSRRLGPTVWDILSLLTLAAWLIGLARERVLSTPIAVWAFAAFFFYLIASRLPGDLPRGILRGGLPVASALTLAIVLAYGNLRSTALILALLAAVYGAMVVLYLMVAQRNQGIRWDLFTMLSSLVLLARPMLEERISLELALITLGAVALALALGRRERRGLSRAVRIGFRVGLPIAAVISLVGSSPGIGGRIVFLILLASIAYIVFSLALWSGSRQ